MPEVTYADLSGIRRDLSALASAAQANMEITRRIEVKQDTLDSRIAALQAEFDGFYAEFVRSRDLQLAETQIVKIRQEIETKFGHYGEVRKRATGILEAFDAGLVTHGTVQHTTEDVMMKTPRYWLAPALVVLAAWSRDDQELARRALDEALRRDADKVALFFSLVMRRYLRQDVAARWLRDYFSRQDPTALAREFIVLLDAVTNGAFGPVGLQVAGEQIDVWLEDLANEAGFERRQEDRWTSALGLFQVQVDPAEFPHLADGTPDWAALATNLGQARSHHQILGYFEGVFTGEVHLPRRLEEQIDDLLTQLVSRYDDEELPLRREESKVQSIIDNQGDRTAAAREFEDKEHALQETTDFYTLLTNAALHAQETGASKGTQRYATALSREWLVSAHDRLTARIRNEAPRYVSVQVEDFQASLPRQGDQSPARGELEAHFQRRTEKDVVDVKLMPGHWIALAVAIASLLLAFVSLPGSLVMILGTLAGGAYFAYGLMTLESRRAKARQNGNERKRQAHAVFDNYVAEWVDYQTAWQAADEVAERTHEYLVGINPIEHVRTRREDGRQIVREVS